MAKLSVNLNKIALLRNSRSSNYPNLEYFAKKAVLSGADGITIHPRPDQRHAKFDDIFYLKKLCLKHKVELNIEGYPYVDFINACIDNNVDQVTLVPDSPEQITSDHGWNVSQNMNFLKEILIKLRKAEIRSSLFMDLSLDEIAMAKSVGADRIELHTESYARSFENNSHKTHVKGFIDAYNKAVSMGLEVNAGHDLNLNNLGFFLKHVNVKEVSIGHALTVESLEFGWERTINNYKDICNICL